MRAGVNEIAIGRAWWGDPVCKSTQGTEMEDVICCPQGVVNDEEGLSGCGSYNVGPVDENGCAECFDCGLYFPVAPLENSSDDVLDNYNGMPLDAYYGHLGILAWP
jgi:hypothetical protein